MQEKSDFETRANMVHHEQPDKDPARRYNAMYGRRTQERMESYGEHLPTTLRGH